MSEPPRVLPAGPAATYLVFNAEPSPELSRHLRALSHSLEASRPAGVRDLVLGYASILIEHDPALRRAALHPWLQAAQAALAEAAAASTVTVPVHYGLGADKQVLERRLGLSFTEIVRLHAAGEYTVAFTGFTPGFPYLLGLPQALHLPRRPKPRLDIPAGAVAIAGGQAGIYPAASPGGWWVLGRTSFTLYDPARHPPTVLLPGDGLRFTLAEGAFVEPHPPAPASDAKGREVARLEAAWPKSASLQAGPRWGVGAYGLAQAGALDPLSLSLGNELLGNPADASALELIAHPLRLLALQTTNVCVTGGGFRLSIAGKEVPRWQVVGWPQGSELRLEPAAGATGLTAYLCVAGGFAAQHHAGSSSTDARGAVGGFGGRYLQAGDRLRRRAGETPLPAAPYRGLPRYPERLRLRVHPGPQANAEALQLLTRSSYRVVSLDRMGVQLEGPAASLPNHDVLSEGSPWGAVQVPASGQPIILLADRGRTGGYAKPAVVDVADLWKLAQARPGTELWFTLAEDGADSQAH